MELVYFILLTVAGLLYWRYVTVRNRRHERLLKEFIAHIVPCKVEKRDGEFFVYNTLTSQFLAQCKSGKELEDLLPLDIMYMSENCDRTVFDEIDNWENAKT